MNLVGWAITRLHDDEIVTYRAWNPFLGQSVLMRAPGRDGLDEGVAETLRREHALADRLEPDWAARPLRMIRHEERPALLLSDPGGAVLAAAVASPLAVDRVLRLGESLSDAIRRAHEAGLVHGDIRPANVLVTDGDRCRLTGFGRARPRLTGETGGAARDADPRDDLHALGSLLYALVTGTSPTPGRPARPGERAEGVPARLDETILRLLAPDPAHRHASAEQVVADLSACAADLGSRRGSPAVRPAGDRARLLEAVRILSRQLTPEDVGRTLVRLGIDLAGASSGTLVLLAHEPHVAAASGTGPSGAALTERLGAVVREVAGAGRALVLGPSPALVLGVPLIEEESPVGVLCLTFAPGAAPPGMDMIEAVAALAAQGATSLATARRHMDVVLREALLSEGEHLSHAGSWCMHLASGRLTWSPEHFRILGMEPDPAGSTRLDWFLERVHPDDRQRCDELFAAAVRDRRVFELDYRVKSLDGQIRHVHGSGRPLYDSAGEVHYYIGMLMDVTRRKLAEDRFQQAQAELAHVNRIAMLGELVASIAHEVSQPIGAGSTNCEAALRWLQRAEPDLVEVENAIRRAIQNGRRAGDVLNRLRALVRNSPPELVALDLNAVVHEALPVIQQELSRREVTLELGLAPDALEVAGDAIQLQQVMINLVVNAAQAMETMRDRRRVVKLTTLAGEGDHARLVVRDTGPGLDAETRERLFSAFFTTKPNGLGVGLSICRSIIESHAGTIRALPAEGGGAVFEVSLPRLRGARA
ncbi:ATP-binding protein [Salinarimonas soli]|nr:ATP-binding protein [Salinarimonas soli]